MPFANKCISASKKVSVRIGVLKYVYIKRWIEAKGMSWLVYIKIRCQFI